MNGTVRSESVEMYLKSVAELGGDRRPIPIGRVADRLGVTPASTNEMMKRLGEQGFIHHQPYKGVTLTPTGKRLAHNVIRRQRLWECFLVDSLQMDWAKAHDLACDLEHATAPEVVDALAAYLNNPAYCPHGNPIPTPDGDVLEWSTVPLASLDVGETGAIQAITPESSELLAYLAQRGLIPGRSVTVLEAAPLQGPLTLRVGTGETFLGLNLAELVLVKKMLGE